MQVPTQSYRLKKRALIFGNSHTLELKGSKYSRRLSQTEPEGLVASRVGDLEDKASIRTLLQGASVASSQGRGLRSSLLSWILEKGFSFYPNGLTPALESLKQEKAPCGTRTRVAVVGRSLKCSGITATPLPNDSGI